MSTRAIGALRASLVACLMMLPWMAHAVDMDVLVGFGQSTTSGARYRPNCWIPITVYLTGQGARGVGQLQVSVRQTEGDTIYTRRVPLTEGTLNEADNFVIQLHGLDLYSMVGNGNQIEIDVRLMLDGRAIAGPKKVALPGAVGLETYSVLGLTRDSSGFDFLTRKKLGLVHRGYNPASIVNVIQTSTTPANQRTAINPGATLQVLYTDPRALPAAPQGYDMIDAVALADQPLDNLTRDQIEAIKGYVQLGGLLILSGGGDTARLKNEFFREMLPIFEPRIEIAQDLPALASRYRRPLQLHGGIALAFGALKPEARGLLTDSDGRPLVASMPYGAGYVVYTAFDFMDPSIRAWTGETALWHDLLRSGNGAVSPRRLLAETSRANAGSLMIEDALAGVRASKAPPAAMLFVFCGAYLLLLVPVNYLVLKKLDRREWTWVTAPVLILGFTFASYLFARSIKGGALTVNRVVVFETSANSDVAAGYAQMTLYSPERTGYDISLGAPDRPDNPYRLTVPSEVFMSTGQNLGQDLAIETDQTGTTIRGALVRLWDKRSFDTPVLASLGSDLPGLRGSIDATTSALPDGKHVSVTVTNRTRFTLDHCELLGQYETIQIGRLAPGAAATHILSWNIQQLSGGIPVTYDPPKNPTVAQDSATLSDSPAATRQRIADSLAAVLSSTSGDNAGNGMQGTDSTGYGRAVNAFVGWFHDPVLDVRVDGQAPSGQEVNMILAHLPSPMNSSSTLAGDQNPFAAAAVTAFEDQPLPGLQGIFR